MNTAGIVVVGGGLAAAKTVEALREKGFDGQLTIVAEEAELPYERPPLSKGYLTGDVPFDDAVVHDGQWYDQHEVELRRGIRATGLALDAHELRLSDESTLHYGQLLLATGASPRLLGVGGAVADGVRYLRTRADSDAIRGLFGEGRHVAVVGAGWIGLEVAAAARQSGTRVTLVERADLPLAAVLGPEVAAVFAHLHRDHGVDLRLGTILEDIRTEAGVATGVRLGGDATVDASAVVIGIGVVPNTELALDAGLAVGNGILVDASLRTSDPDVWAVGDVAAHDHPLLGRIRVEHWANALNQPAVAAAAMLGEDVVYDELPYFFSDQYDLGMEYIGHAPPGSYARVVVRGDLDARTFVAFWLDGEHRVLAAMNVNVWDVVDAIKPVIADRRAVDPERLADPAVPLAEI
jgi:3-phenylpropionate/trans-cinnamate dioxygenase ferredoxin reductase subunit